MRREVEIYINTAGFGETVTYKRLDIFSEESINITNSIQDIRDIAKVLQTTLNNLAYLLVLLTT